MNRLKIAIIESNRYLRESLTQLINDTQGMKCVGAFLDATDIVYHIHRTLPEVVLMDMDLSSKMGGIEAVFQIKEHFPNIFIIIQTVCEDKVKLLQAIKAGASGYLVKNTPPMKILEAIQDVVAGGVPMAPMIANTVLEMFRQTHIAPPCHKAALEEELTVRQKEILDCIIKGKSYKSIAEELFISVDTVKFHAKNIYDILQIHSRPELMARFIS